MKMDKRKRSKKYGNPQRNQHDRGAGPDLAAWDELDMSPSMGRLAVSFDREMESRQRPHMLLRPWDGFHAWMMIDASSERGVEETYDRFNCQYVENVMRACLTGVPDDVSDLMDEGFSGEDHDAACEVMTTVLSATSGEVTVPRVSELLVFVWTVVRAARATGRSAADSYAIRVSETEGKDGFRVQIVTVGPTGPVTATFGDQVVYRAGA